MSKINVNIELQDMQLISVFKRDDCVSVPEEFQPIKLKI